MADDMLRNRVVFDLPDMKKNCSRKERVYKTVNGLELNMAVYAPNQKIIEAKTPGIIFIHGGPFSEDIQLLPTEWGQYISLGQLAAAFGLIGITFHHRFHDLSLLEESAQDVEDAIKYVREAADHYCLDRDKLCLWAISGGGPYLGPPLRSKPDYLKCFEAYYTRLDMRGVKAAEQILSLETLRKFSPVAVLEEQIQRRFQFFLPGQALTNPI